MSDDDLLAIRVTTATNHVAAVKTIRETTGLSIAEIKTALAAQTPIAVATFYRIDHDENELAARSLFDNLRAEGVEFEIILNGDVESREYFDNAMDRWREIGVHTQMMADLESGEPCVETLEWLRSTGSAEVFQQTLRQIVNSDGYNVDAETFDWAKRHLSHA